MRARAGPRLVTLTSDIGAAYAAQMKAVLVHRIPPGRVVDLAHDLRAHAIGEAAFLLRAMAIGFPPGTVHVAVVDPGVGGRRAPIAIDCADGSALVGPDNGVLIPLADALGQPIAYRIDPARLGARPRVGRTFDGRDLFAPAAARLAQGLRARALGPRIRAHRYAIPVARRRGAVASGEILHEDRFGNLITNVPTGWLPSDARSADVRLRGRPARRVPVVASYEALGRGRTGLLGSSFGTLEVAVARGVAARRWRAGVGDAVTVRWAPRTARTGNGK